MIHGKTIRPEKANSSHEFSQRHSDIFFMGAAKLPFRMPASATIAIPHTNAWFIRYPEVKACSMDHACPARQAHRARESGCHLNMLWARVRFMSKWALRIAILICPLVLLAGQDIDANITTQNRRPSTIADQISDPAERTAFLALFQETQPKRMLERVKVFLSRFSQSAFLFQAYEMAARASFALEDYDAGLNYAKQSLTLLPENPLLLVSVADVEAQKHLNDAAISDARDAIEYFDQVCRSWRRGTGRMARA